MDRDNEQNALQIQETLDQLLHFLGQVRNCVFSVAL